MSKAQRGHIFVFVAEVCEDADDLEQFGKDDLETVPHLDQFGVVRHKAAGGTQVNDGFRGGALGAEHMDVAHHVMTQLGFFRLGGFKVDIVQMGFHFRDLFVRDGKPQFLFGFCQSDPESAPGGVFLLGRPVVAHFLAGIAPGQRVLIRIVIAHDRSFPLDCFVAETSHPLIYTRKCARASGDEKRMAKITPVHSFFHRPADLQSPAEAVGRL